MKKLLHLLFTLGIGFLYLPQTYGQLTTTITANRSAGPALEWQGARYTYAASTHSYSLTNGWDIIPGMTDAAYGRYRFNHPSFKNSRIQTVSLTVTCSRGIGTGPGIAYVTMPSCTDLWSSSQVSVNAQNLYSCLSGAAILQSNGNNITINTNNDGSSLTQTYWIYHYDPAMNLNNANWDPNANYIVLGLRPFQNPMVISDIKVNITYLPDPAITGNSICCSQTFTLSGSAALTSNGTLGGGNGTYAYQWQSSPNNSTWTNISGATTASYTTPTITQTMYYRRVVTSGTASASNSNVATMTIVIPPITGNSICCNQAFVSSGSATLTPNATIGGGNGSYSYQWQSSPNNSSWANISGATTASYTTPTITQTTYYRRVVASAGISNSDNYVKITIYPPVTGNMICCDQTHINYAYTMLPFDQKTGYSVGGGSGVYTYQWQSSINSGATWTTVPNATNAFYNPVYNPGFVYQTTQYRRVITSAIVISYSNAVTLTVIPGVRFNEICCDQTFAGPGNPYVLNQDIDVDDLDIGGAYTVQWESSLNNTTYTSISGATNLSYDPPVTSQTTYFRRKIVVTSNNYTDYSNSIKITINPSPNISNNNICCSQSFYGSSGDPVAFTHSGPSLGGGDGTYTYQWQSSLNGSTWTAITTNGTSASYDPPLLTQKTYYRRLVSSSTAPQSTSNVVTVNLLATGACANNFANKATTGIIRAHGVGVSVGNKGYVGLGSTDGYINGNLKDFWEYDAATNIWIQKTDFPGVSRAMATAFVLNDKVYVGMGRGATGQILSDFYEYNPATNTWTQKASFPSAKMGLGFSAGGYGYSAFVNGLELWQYIPTDMQNGLDANGNPKGAWVQKQSYPTLPGLSTANVHPLTINNTGYAYCSKAIDNYGGTINYLYQYDAASTANGNDVKGNPKGAWVVKANIPLNYVCSYLFTASGKAYFSTIWGGTKAYDPATNTYSNAEPYGLEIFYNVGFSINNVGYVGYGYEGEVSDAELTTVFRRFSPTDLVTGVAPISTLTGATFNLAYTLPCGDFNATTTFTAQLSDANGSFVSPVNIGSATSASSGNISVTIPTGTANGTKYRIRVISSSPSMTGADNGTDIAIQTNVSRIASDEALSVIGSEPGVLIYPNPVSDQFEIHLNGQEIKTIEISNVNGSIVYIDNSVFTESAIIDTDSWSSGIFFVRIVTEDGKIIIRKLIKN